ncbi:hypothetical protein FEM48_Zijuj03G0028900 [Ziziphus jujuba var. spinosa]|uniref:DUF4219 domain-containing protein n=1 Tax=Ziziphus jujuba var. spinosa TaxID=714518 RepID=A0A978VMR4_ZIZJJ|nr:hypothetical protein FEM48_Zijuj03G0028900 [Ziziphus jujuba var. spinosa]
MGRQLGFIVRELLDKKNYLDWSVGVKTYLMGEDLWDIVESMDEPPKPKDRHAFKYWRSKNASALHAIQISCNTDAFSKIRDMTSAKKAWDTLEKEFNSESESESEDDDEAIVIDGDRVIKEIYTKLSTNTKMNSDPSLDIHMEGKYLMLAVQELVYGDQREGRFVFCRDSKKPKQSGNDDRFTKDGMNPKSLLQTLMMRAGHSPPKYKTKHLKTNEFRALVEFKEALAWLTHTTDNSRDEDDKSPPDVTDNMLKLLRKHRRSKRSEGSKVSNNTGFHLSLVETSSGKQKDGECNGLTKQSPSEKKPNYIR